MSKQIKDVIFEALHNIHGVYNKIRLISDSARDDEKMERTAEIEMQFSGGYNKNDDEANNETKIINALIEQLDNRLKTVSINQTSIKTYHHNKENIFSTDFNYHSDINVSVTYIDSPE